MPDTGSADRAVEDLELARLLADITRDDGVRLIAGVAASGRNDDLILAALSESDGRQVSRLVNRSPNSQGVEGCRTEIAPDLVPGGASIVASCTTGGSNGLGYVSVLGVDPDGSVPRVLIELSCSVTGFRVEDSTLRIVSEGEKPGFRFPGAVQPDQILIWNGTGLNPEDFQSFDRYCTTGSDRYSGGY